MGTGGGDADCMDDSWEKDFEEEDNGKFLLNQMDHTVPSSNDQSQQQSL